MDLEVLINTILDFDNDPDSQIELLIDFQNNIKKDKQINIKDLNKLMTFIKYILKKQNVVKIILQSHELCLTLIEYLGPELEIYFQQCIPELISNLADINLDVYNSSQNVIIQFIKKLRNSEIVVHAIIKFGFASPDQLIREKIISIIPQVLMSDTQIFYRNSGQDEARKLLENLIASITDKFQSVQVQARKAIGKIQNMRMENFQVVFKKLSNDHQNQWKTVTDEFKIIEKQERFFKMQSEQEITDSILNNLSSLNGQQVSLSEMKKLIEIDVNWKEIQNQLFKIQIPESDAKILEFFPKSPQNGLYFGLIKGEVMIDAMIQINNLQIQQYAFGEITDAVEQLHSLQDIKHFISSFFTFICYLLQNVKYQQIIETTMDILMRILILPGIANKLYIPMLIPLLIQKLSSEKIILRQKSSHILRYFFQILNQKTMLTYLLFFLKDEENWHTLEEIMKLICYLFLENQGNNQEDQNNQLGANLNYKEIFDKICPLLDSKLGKVKTISFETLVLICALQNDQQYGLEILESLIDKKVFDKITDRISIKRHYFLNKENQLQLPTQEEVDMAIQAEKQYQIMLKQQQMLEDKKKLQSKNKKKQDKFAIVLDEDVFENNDTNENNNESDVKILQNEDDDEQQLQQEEKFIQSISEKSFDDMVENEGKNKKKSQKNQSQQKLPKEEKKQLSIEEFKQQEQMMFLKEENVPEYKDKNEAFSVMNIKMTDPNYANKQFYGFNLKSFQQQQEDIKKQQLTLPPQEEQPKSPLKKQPIIQKPVKFEISQNPMEEQFQKNEQLLSEKSRQILPKAFQMNVINYQQYKFEDKSELQVEQTEFQDQNLDFKDFDTKQSDTFSKKSKRSNLSITKSQQQPKLNFLESTEQLYASITNQQEFIEEIDIEKNQSDKVNEIKPKTQISKQQRKPPLTAKKKEISSQAQANKLKSAEQCFQEFLDYKEEKKPSQQQQQQGIAANEGGGDISYDEIKKPLSNKQKKILVKKNLDLSPSTKEKSFIYSQSQSILEKKQPQQNFDSLTQQMQYIEFDQLGPLHDPEYFLNKVFIDLAAPDWQDQIEALNNLRRLCKHHLVTLYNQNISISQLITFILNSADSLRSAVSKTAMITIQDLCTVLRKSLDPYLEQMLKTIFKRGNDSNQFISQQAKKTLDSIVKNCSLNKILEYLYKTYKVDRNQFNTIQYRDQIAHVMEVIIIVNQAQTLQIKDFPRFLFILAVLLDDANFNTRRVAKKAFYKLLQQLDDLKGFQNNIQTILPEMYFKKLQELIRKKQELDNKMRKKGVDGKMAINMESEDENEQYVMNTNNKQKRPNSHLIPRNQNSQNKF